MKIVHIIRDGESDLVSLIGALKSGNKNIEVKEVDRSELFPKFISNQPKPFLPALIIIDVNILSVASLEILASLKNSPETNHIPVLMLSVNNDQRFVRYAYEKGVNAFVVKPKTDQEYSAIAEMISFFFINNYTAKHDDYVSRRFADKSILVIEDNADQWALMQYSLKVYLPEVRVLMINNKESTLDFLTDTWNSIKNPPELILLDLYLPTRREGLNLLDSIRYFFLIHKLAPVPVIIVSVSDFQDDIEISYRHKANAYIIKSGEANQPFSNLPLICNFWWQLTTMPQN